jgi:hypothetical protein
MNKYQAAKGAMFNDEQAQKIGERLEVLAEENGGKVTYEVALNDAKFKRSPMYDLVEWDDEIASNKYRAWQVRQIMSHIEIVVPTNGDERPIKAFHNVTVTNLEDGISERAYMPVMNVLSDAEYHQQIIEKALRELDGWRERYKEYQELKKIFKVIDEARRFALLNA